MTCVLDVLKRTQEDQRLIEGRKVSGNFDLSEPLDSSDSSRDPLIGSMGMGFPFLIMSQKEPTKKSKEGVDILEIPN